MTSLTINNTSSSLHLAYKREAILYNGLIINNIYKQYASSFKLPFSCLVDVDETLQVISALRTVGKMEG